MTGRTKAILINLSKIDSSLTVLTSLDDVAETWATEPEINEFCTFLHLQELKNKDTGKPYADSSIGVAMGKYYRHKLNHKNDFFYRFYSSSVVDVDIHEPTISFFSCMFEAARAFYTSPIITVEKLRMGHNLRIKPGEYTFASISGLDAVRTALPCIFRDIEAVKAFVRACDKSARERFEDGFSWCRNFIPNATYEEFRDAALRSEILDTYGEEASTKDVVALLNSALETNLDVC